MPDYRYSLVDVFAANPLEGNLLPVVEAADNLSSATMATLARRFNLAETSYIQSSSTPDATYRHRIFVVNGEISFAGHPSLGTAAVWAWRHGLTNAELIQEPNRCWRQSDFPSRLLIHSCPLKPCRPGCRP
jgi:PhzF family phenazine biosynthesis protein